MRTLSDELKTRIKKDAKKIFKDHGEIELNKFNQLVLAKIPINYKDYVLPGKKLRDFFALLKDIVYIREIKTENSVEWYCGLHEHKDPKIIIDNENKTPEPIKTTTFHKSEVTQMHALSFMDYWSNNSKKLQQYTQLVKSPNEWSQIIARNLFNALLGVNEFYCYVVNDVAKFVFNTGLKTINDNTLYCVIEANPRNIEGLQPFKLENFCCPGEDGSDLSNEIKENIPEIITADVSIDSKYEELRNILEQLIELQEALSNAKVEDAVTAGVALTSKVFGLLKQYYSKWEVANEIINYIGWNMNGKEDISIEFIANRLEYSNKKNDLFNKAVDIINDVLGRVLKYCNEYQIKSVASTVEKDLETVNGISSNDYTKLNSIIEQYLCLLELVEEKEVTEDVALKMEDVEAYFKNLSPKIQTKFFVNQSDEILLAGNATILREAISLLSMMDATTVIDTEEFDDFQIDTNDLFNKVINSPSPLILIEVLSYISKFPENQFEKDLALGNYTHLVNLLEKEDLVIPHTITKDEIVSNLINLQETEKETNLTLYDCGMRIFNIIGNHNRTAEKYFIAGLIVDPKSNSEALLDLYFSENDSQKFYIIWQCFCENITLSPDKFKFMLSYLLLEGEWAVEKYLSTTPYYYYMDGYVQSIIEVFAESGYTSVLQQANNGLLHINDLLPINEFENFIVNCAEKTTAVSGTIKKYINTNQEVIESLGYTTEELIAIETAIEFSIIDEPHVSPLEKLYYIQKNKNGTVEGLLWKSMSVCFNEQACLLLMRVLEDAARLDELIFLYECYEKAMQNNRAAREMYLHSLFHTRNDKVYNYVRENFQDCVRMLDKKSSYHSIMRALFEDIVSEKNDKLVDFINNIARVYNLINNPILKSIVLLSNDLREIALDAEKLFEFGLDQTQTDNFVSVYKTDSYSRDRSIVGTAERIYTFVGICANAAEEIAAFAEYMGSDIIELMWKIHRSKGNIDNQFEMIQSNPAFKIGKEIEYCSILFKKGLYREFLEEVNKVDYNPDEYVLQLFIANCNLKLDISDQLERVAANMKIMSADILTEITYAMINFGYIVNYEDFIIMHIEHILSNYVENEIKSIVSANGKADNDILKNLQKKAAAAGQETLVCYLYENFEIGRYKGASKEYLKKTLEICTSDDLDSIEKKNIYRQLRIIYSNNSECVTKIVLCEIEFILACDASPDIKQKEITNIIDHIAMTENGLKAFMNISAKNELLMSETICTSILRAGIEMQMQSDCIDYINNVVRLEMINDTELLYMLYILYRDTVDNGTFKEEWRPSIERVCLKLVNTKYFSVAVYSLYKNYLELNEYDIAKFALLLLNDNKEKISEQLLKEIESELEKVFDKPVDMFNLFIHMAEHTDTDQFEEYCRKCGNLIIDKNSLIGKYRQEFNAEKLEALSKSDINFLIKLLYANPDNVEYWRNCLKMPLEGNPIAHSKILYKVALMENKLQYWKQCIENCEEYSQGELMSKALLSCAQLISAPFFLRDFREYLCAKAEGNPIYFALMDEKCLTDIILVLCSRSKENEGASIHHNAIRELATIAIATDSINVFNAMHTHLEEYLYGANSNIGFAVACRLILRKNFTDALAMLKKLASSSNLKYPKLINKLSKMSIDELKDWSFIGINNQLLNIIIPDGNLPNIEEINEFTLNYSTNGKAEDATRLICEILENNPKDYGCYMALFILCKQLPHRIDLLHRALCGLIQNNPLGTSYYNRHREDYAVFLAKVNEIILAKKLTNQKDLFGSYDFRTSAEEYYIKYESNFNKVNDTTILERIRDAREDTRSALANQSKENLEIVSNIILSSITGNWYEIILKCWHEDLPLGIYMDNYYTQRNSNDGLARNILKVIYSLDVSKRNEFKNWIAKHFKVFTEQVHTAMYLYDRQYFKPDLYADVLELNIFDLPFEEYPIFVQIYKNTVMQFVSKAPEKLHSCGIIVGALTKENDAMNEFWHTAKESFKAANDNVAYGMFTALHILNKEFNLEHWEYQNEKDTRKDTRKNHETYESLMRVSGAFINNETIVNKISSPKMKPHSCMNMVLSLMYTSRANEVNRLKKYFHVANQILTDAIIVTLDPDIEDNVKLAKLDAIEDEVARALLCYVLLRKNVKTGLKTLDAIKKIDIAYRTIAKTYPYVFSLTDNPSPKKYLCVEKLANINKNAFKQLEDLNHDLNNEVVPVVKIDEEKIEVNALSFVAEIEPTNETDVSIDKLWEDHESVYSFGLEGHKQKLEISRRIYGIVCSKNPDQLTLNDFAIRYGVDYYYFCIGNNNYQDAKNVIIEMVNAYEQDRKSVGAEILKKTVCKTALYEILFHGYTNIYEMVESYAKNKQVFIRMRNMLPGSMQGEIADVNGIFNALEYLEKNISNFSQDMLPSIRGVLFTAIHRLGDIGVTNWANVKALVYRMIREEINKIDERPVLTLDILSQNAHLPYGNIFGQIKNVGNAVAENIQVLISYEDETMSNPYLLPRLDKGDIATFEIPYSAADDTTAITYDVTITFTHSGEEISHVEKDKVLVIESDNFENYDSGIYLTDRPISDFIVLDNGDVYSDNFFGRVEEIRSINNIFSGQSFESYKNVIIKGIRRAGKTSILNYLKTYINANCDDAIAIYTDCSGIGDDPTPIYTALVKPAIKESKFINSETISEEKWDKFEKKWSLSVGDVDYSPDDLQYFYRELKIINNKGMMLIVDEFDILLETVENNKGVDSSLLPSLRGLLNNADCQNAVHLVICGSNKMIKYMDGGTFNQFFQQFGSNDIEIGMLLRKEMETMLEVPLKKNFSHVRFAPESLDWIWKYTHGLVWYSKLVATYALERARKNTRTVVYPSDIVHSVTTVVSNDEFFRSLVTSCTSNELKVLDALQGITSRATEYVSASKLVEALSGEFNQKDVETIANTLERMHFIEKNPYDASSYRFAVQLYWHYFRKNPSNFVRIAEIPVQFKEKKN